MQQIEFIYIRTKLTKLYIYELFEKKSLSVMGFVFFSRKNRIFIIIKPWYIYTHLISYAGNSHNIWEGESFYLVKWKKKQIKIKIMPYLALFGLIIIVITSGNQVIRNISNSTATIANSTLLIWIVGNIIQFLYCIQDHSITGILMVIGTVIFIVKNSILYRNKKSVITSLLHISICFLSIYIL